MGPCHHGITRPQGADEADGFQIWRVAAIVDSRQRVVLTIRFGRGPNRKENSLLRDVTQGLGIGWILCNDLGNGKCHLEDLDIDGKMIVGS